MRLCYNARCSAGVAQLVERVIGNDEVHGSDSHHQLHKNSHPLWVVVFMAFSGRESEGGSEKAPVGLFPAPGERKPEAAQSAGQAARRLRGDSHHQLHKNSHPLWVAVFMAFSGRESEGGEKKPVGLFPAPGERKPEAAPPIGQAARRLRVDSHHQHAHKLLRSEIPRQARDDKFTPPIASSG